MQRADAVTGVMLQWRCRPFDELGVFDLYAWMRLRQQVFALEQQCAYVDADGLDASSHHLLGFDDRGALQAGLRIVAPGVKYAEPSIGRVVAAAAVRRTGTGRALMAEGIAQCERLYPGQRNRISAQAHLQRFYEGFGFSAIGAAYMEDGIPHLEMLRGA